MSCTMQQVVRQYAEQGTHKTSALGPACLLCSLVPPGNQIFSCVQLATLQKCVLVRSAKVFCLCCCRLQESEVSRLSGIEAAAARLRTQLAAADTAVNEKVATMSMLISDKAYLSKEVQVRC